MMRGEAKSRTLNRGYLYRNKFIVKVFAATDAFLRFVFRKKCIMPSTVRQILIIKPDHLGDVYLMGSVLPLLVGRYPNCAIDLVAGSWAKPVAENLPLIRDVYYIDHWMLNRKKISILKKIILCGLQFFSVLRQVRLRHYDICICLRAFGGNFISLGAASRTSYLAGHGTGALGPLLDAEAKWQEGVHEVEHHMEVLALCGIEPVKYTELRYPTLGGSDALRCAQQQQSMGMPSDYTVIFPCSGATEKMFSVGYWRKMILQAPEVFFVIIVGPEERKIAAEIIDGYSNATLAAGLFSIPDLVVVLSKATHIHCVDSFGSHLAGSSGVRTTVHCRFGGSDMRQFHPLGEKVKAHFVDDEA